MINLQKQEMYNEDQLIYQTKMKNSQNFDSQSLDKISIIKLKDLSLINFNIHIERISIMSIQKSLYEQVVSIFRSDPNKTNNILTKVQNNIFWIIFNRPKRLNAFTMDMYVYYKQLIEVANSLENIKFIVVTGTGGNFSSGNDLANFTDPRLEQYHNKIKQLNQVMARILQQLCNAFIDSRKPLYALVQGKVIGYTFTKLTLFDRVYASDNTQFNAPLVKIAQGPEMCSSYMFPKIFGSTFGEQLIIQGKTVNSATLQKFNFVKRYKNQEIARTALMNYLNEINQLQWQSFLAARQLFRNNERALLKQINAKWCNPDIVPYLIKYMQKKTGKIKAKL